MHKFSSFNFLNLLRLTLIGLVLISIHIFTPKSYASLSVPVNALAVDPTNSNILYAGGGGNIYKSTDGGNTWVTDPNHSAGHLVIDPTNPNILYASTGTSGNRMIKSVDAGASWTDVTNNLGGSTDIEDLVIDPINPNKVYVAMYQSSNCQGVWYTTDGGTTWNGGGPTCDVARLAIDPTNDNIIYATSAHTVYKSTDGGVTWSNPGNPPLNTSSSVLGLAIDPSNPNILYAGGGAKIYKSTDGGTNWTQTNWPIENVGDIVVDPINHDTIYAVGDTIALFQSTDGGANWTGVSSFNTIYHLVIAPSNPIDLYVLTGSGLYINIIHSVAISPIPSPNPDIYEGDTYSYTGTFNDPVSTSWTATVDYGDGSGAQPLILSGTNFTLSHVFKVHGGYTVTVSITGNRGTTGTQHAQIQVYDAPPTVGAISVSPNPVQVSTPITASANFTDPGVLDTHTASWNWGDGNTTTGTVTESNGSGSVSNTHTYTSTGVYVITLSVIDGGGNGLTSTQTFQYIAVYDSSTAFAGGRSFDNPSTASPSTTGKVSFGISAKYNNNNVLTGNVKMNFKAASIDFASISLSSLATSNGKAYLKGSGTVNGSGSYTFLASGIDGSVVGGNDLIRFQITDPSNNNNVIYDSQPGAGDTTDPTTSDATGNIRVH